MARLWNEIFCCCNKRHRSSSPHEPDENTHLIRPTTNYDVISGTPGYVVNHQKLKDRLGTIVRAKEGKMVNVNTPLPFNLHNKTLHGRLDLSSSRSARSCSAHATMGGSTLNRLPDVASRMPSYSPTRDRDPSPSIETSRSTTSLHPGDASYLPPEADHVNGNRRPILNARLVRGPSGYGVGGSFVPGPRKSRSITRGRSGRFGEDGDGARGADGLANGANGIIERQDTQVDGINVCDLPPDLSTGAIKSPSTEASPVATDFKIEDVGKIACSWGD